jgi:glucose/arabinose dehydrogenase
MNKNIHVLFLIAIFVFAYGFLFQSCKNSNGNSNINRSAEENYLNYCAGCHGLELNRFQQKDWMTADNNDAIIASIIDGLPEMGMPAFRKTFSDDEIVALADYIRAELPDESDEQPASTLTAIHSSDEFRFVVDTVVSGLDVPWGLEFLPDGDLLISERSGTLFRFSNNKLHEISGLPPIYARGQGGLLDIKLHPEYASNGWIYIAYSYVTDQEGQEGGNTAVLRARLRNNDLYDLEVIFRGLPASNRAHHFGCKLDFDKDGYLFFGIGDRGERDVNPQSLENHNGKMHRIHDDGRIPVDNPFVDTPGAMPSIYSYGHRNPQGNVVHPETGEFWQTEHGPRGGDELNLIKPGLNYGWPVISYGINYDGTVFTEITEKEGMEQPVLEWTPSIAPCGMIFVKGDRYKNWENNILVGSLRFMYVERVVLEGQKVVHREKLLEGIGRVRNVLESPDGYIYVSIENPGKIVRIIPIDL